MTDTKTVWAVYTNTDLTEGRGKGIFLCLCETLATAKRKAFKAGVQGTDADVFEVELIKHRNFWYGPVEIEKPTADDIRQQQAIDLKLAAEKKARELGLTEEDIKALRLG